MPVDRSVHSWIFQTITSLAVVWPVESQRAVYVVPGHAAFSLCLPLERSIKFMNLGLVLNSMVSIFRSRDSKGLHLPPCSVPAPEVVAPLPRGWTTAFKVARI
jgi:hypothetical protein